MKVVLILAGLLIGSALGGFVGAAAGVLVAGAVIAWIDKRKSAQAAPADTLAAVRESSGEDLPKNTPEPDTIARRLQSLEAEVASLRARLDRLAPQSADEVLASAARVPADLTLTVRDQEPSEAPMPVAPIAPQEVPLAPGPSSELEPQPVPTPSIAPARPSWVSRLVDACKSWLFGGNTVARLGILVLLLGLSFLAKYAVDRDLIPPEWRIGFIALIAIALLVLGWRARLSKPAFAMTLQGGAIAALYLDVFAAYRLYQLMPIGLAFGLAVAICAFSCVLAVAQNAMALAILGAGGGFAAPLLLSTGSGSHTALFGYYLLLDLGIAGVAMKKSWRPLYLTGFLFTFVIAGLWGYHDYRPEHYRSVQPFLAAFVLLFIAIVLIESRKAPARLTHAVDGTLVFGPPLAGFAAQAALVRGIPWAAAWSAVAFGAIYLLLALLLRRGGPLGRVFLVIGVGFLTLAIPLAFDSRITSAVWAVEGAGVVWFGLRQHRWLPLATGLALQFVASLLLLEKLQTLDTVHAFLNARWIGITLISAAALISAWHLRKADLAQHARLSGVLRTWVSPLLLAWGLLWWLSGNIAEFDTWRWVSDAGRFTAGLILMACTASALLLAYGRADWRHAGLAVHGLLPLLAIGAWGQSATAEHPAQAWAGLGWLLAFGAHERALRTPIWPRPWMATAQHSGRTWLVCLLLGWQAAWGAERITGAAAWPLAAWALVIASALLALHRSWAERHWPMNALPAAYKPVAARGLAILLVGWLWGSSISDDPLRTGIAYLPLLNPTDLMVALIALALYTWWRGETAGTVSPTGSDRPQITPMKLAIGAIGVSLFFALNAIVLRGVAHYARLDYNLDRLADSALAQTAISLLWGSCALVAMVAGARRGLRAPWLIGAALLALVVAKLFLVDLSAWGGLTRVISFLGVGALMLVIGYFAPLPPARPTATPPSTTSDTGTSA